MSEPLEVVAHRILQTFRDANKPGNKQNRGLKTIVKGPVFAVVRNSVMNTTVIAFNADVPKHLTDVVEKSIRAQKEVDLKIFELHNVWLTGQNRQSAAPRCEHCARITRGVTVTQSLFVAEGGVVGEMDPRNKSYTSRGGHYKNSMITPIGPQSRGQITPAGSNRKVHVDDAVGTINPKDKRPGPGNSGGPKPPRTPPGGGSVSVKGSPGGNSSSVVASKIGGRFRIYGGMVGRSFIGAVASILFGNIQHRVTKSLIQKELNDLATKVAALIKAKKFDIAALQSGHHKAYATVHSKLWWQHFVDKEPGAVVESDGPPTVSLLSVDIHAQPIEHNFGLQVDSKNQSFGYLEYYYESWSSLEVELPKASVDEWVQLVTRWRDLDFAMGGLQVSQTAKANFARQKIAVERELGQWL